MSDVNNLRAKIEALTRYTPVASKTRGGALLPWNTGAYVALADVLALLGASPAGEEGEPNLWLARDGSGDVFVYKQRPKWSEMQHSFGNGMDRRLWIAIEDTKDFFDIKPGQCVALNISPAPAK